MPQFDDYVSMRPQPGGGAGFFVGNGLGLTREGRLQLRFAPDSPLYVNERGEVALRVAAPLVVATGSPYALTIKDDSSTLAASQIQDDTQGTSVATSLRRLTSALASVNAALAAIPATSVTGANGLIPVGDSSDKLDPSWISGRTLVEAGYGYLDMSAGATTMTTANAKDDGTNQIILSWSWKGGPASSVGVLYVSNLTDATSFEVSSSDAGSKGYFSYAIVNVA